MTNNDYDTNGSSGSPPEKWTLRLYVAGQTPKSLTAFANLKKLCEQNLDINTYEIEVVDLLQTPQLAQTDQIIAIPTLVRIVPAPIRKIIGDLSNGQKVQTVLQFRLPE